MLTDTACRAATCPKDRTRARLADERGLYLEVSPGGSKRWFVKYRLGGTERRLALGSYPEVTLSGARAARDKARQQIKDGTDPVRARRLDRITRSASAAATFETVAREFHSVQSPGWSPRYGRRWIERMEKDLFPRIGPLPIASITAPVLLDALRRIERRGARETAHTLRQTAGQVFRYGIQTGRCERSPAPDLHGALRPVITRNVGALLTPEAVGGLMREIYVFSGQPTTRGAMLLSALTFQRPGNIRAMEWGEVDADSALWTIPAEKMKRSVHGKINGRPHLVPLSGQALAVLDELRPLTGHGRFVFPSLLSGERCMSENAIRAALRRMGYDNDEMTAHGFRAMARTLIAENLPGIAPDVVEAQLAHGKSGPLGMAYDRAAYMAQRVELMKTWADYLDRLRDGAEVVKLPARAA